MITRVAIVEDDADVCEDLAQMIGETDDFTCVCTCRNGRSALRKIPACAPDVVIMDIQLPDSSGIECTAKLRRLAPGLQVVMFTASDEEEQVFKALGAGASGYILKGSDPAQVLAALREIRSGGAPLSGSIAKKIVQSFSRGATGNPLMEPLTPREEEVLGNLAKGCISKEIATNLSISIETVNYHLKQIYQKLDVHTRTEAVVKYLRK
jgi:DNA-binding NarL/FixJ family response regulator